MTIILFFLFRELVSLDRLKHHKINVFLILLYKSEQFSRIVYALYKRPQRNDRGCARAHAKKKRHEKIESATPTLSPDGDNL